MSIEQLARKFAELHSPGFAWSGRSPEAQELFRSMALLAWKELTPDGLSFDMLRQANVMRLPQYKKDDGQPFHHDDGSDWSPNDWMVAVTGEVGEMANVLKKIRRGDYDLSDPKVKDMLRHEAADVVTYMDILSLRLGFSLGDAVVEKFNIVSRRVGADVFMQVRPPQA